MTSQTKTTYRNGFFGQVKDAPEFITVTSRPVDYRGHQIFKRLDRWYDVVLNGVCIHNRVTANGCKLAIDERLGSSLAANHRTTTDSRVGLSKMNIPLRAFIKSIVEPTQEMVGANAKAHGCPEWIESRQCCDIGDECFCAKGAAEVLRLVGKTNEG